MSKPIVMVNKKLLLRVLEPFAHEADSWLESVSPSYHPGMTEPRQRQAYSKAEFSMADLRAARKLHRKLKALK